MNDRDYSIDAFDYPLPDKLIAQHPKEKRSESRLLVLDKSTGSLSDTTFSNISEYLPEKCALVANNSMVLPAKLLGRKESGGKVEFLLLTPVHLIVQSKRDYGGRSISVAEGLIKASKRPKEGEVLSFGLLTVTVLENQNFGKVKARLNWSGSLVDIFLQQGHVPLPPYVKREDSKEDRKRYQTIYANEDKMGSVAAPTAGFHWTADLKQQVVNQGHTWSEVTLYVGYGTFSPVRVQDVRDHTMHEEYIEITEETAGHLKECKKNNIPIVAIGTTTVRCLESMWHRNHSISAFKGWSDLYIRPGFSFGVVDHMVTNFHLPKSSLLLMVSAFAGRENILNAYRHAVSNRYRFFSYGDAMFIR